MSLIDSNSTEKYAKLLQEFSQLDLSQLTELDPEAACKMSLLKIKIAREFAQIDEKILDTTLKSSANDSQYFSEILFLEAKRLRFKEEAIKCIQTRTKSKIKT